MPDKQAVSKIVDCVGDLPAIPAVVAEVLKTTDDPKSDMARVTKVIQADPALTAKILRVSNSPYYGMKQFIGTLKLAIVILGLREVRNIVMGIAAFDTLKGEKTNAEIVHRIWDSSLQAAATAKTLGGLMGLGLQGEEFIAGLLSDIGKIVLYATIGKPYEVLMEDYGNSWAGLCQGEVQEVGCTHADVATALAVRWNLPQGLSDALWYQYPREDGALRNAAEPLLAATLRVTKCAMFDDFSNPEAPLTCLSDTEAWDVLARAKNPIPPESRRAVLQEQIETMRKMPHLPL